MDNRLRELMTDATGEVLTTLETQEKAINLLYKRQDELITRLKATEAALDRVFPDWRSGSMACLPNCQGACCET